MLSWTRYANAYSSNNDTSGAGSAAGTHFLDPSLPTSHGDVGPEDRTSLIIVVRLPPLLTPSLQRKAVSKAALKPAAAQPKKQPSFSSFRTSTTTSTAGTAHSRDLKAERSISASLRSLFHFTGHSTPSTISSSTATLSGNPLTPAPSTDPLHSDGSTTQVQGPQPATNEAAASLSPLPASKIVYPESRGQFQSPPPPVAHLPAPIFVAESVRSVRQEDHSYGTERELPTPAEEWKAEKSSHLRRKAALLWMGLKMKFKLERAERKAESAL